MATVQLQRRYSFTSSTVLDGSQVTPPNSSVRSPKTIALQPVETSCNLCEIPVTSQELERRPPKRDATQLPSPTDPQSLPTKITKLALELDDYDSGYSDDGDTSMSRLPTPPPHLDHHPALQLPQCLPTDTHTPPNFLSLPPEIRNQIYRELPDTLISSRPLIYCLSTFKGRKQHCLAAVCRQIRAESLALFYGYNTWIIKLEFKMMYDAFCAWIRDIGDANAGELRLLQLSVRGRAFRPVSTFPRTGAGVGGPGTVDTVPYICVDGDATFKIDLSERFAGGEVSVMRCDGSRAAGETARAHLADLVEPLWKKRREGRLRGQDFLDMVNAFLTYTGGVA